LIFYKHPLSGNRHSKPRELLVNLMPVKLQSRDEINSNLNVAKAEKINWITYG